MEPDIALDQLDAKLWTELSRARHAKGHGWRTPVLATLDQQHLPQVRTVVLRDSDRQARRFTIYSDRRSPKVAELRDQPRCSLLFWCPRRRWQLRVNGEAQIDTTSEAVSAVWSNLQHSPAAGDYLTVHPPGSLLTAATTTDAVRDSHALCLITVSAISMDWLALRRSGHQRALITASGVSALVP